VLGRGRGGKSKRMGEEGREGVEGIKERQAKKEKERKCESGREKRERGVVGRKREGERKKGAGLKKKDGYECGGDGGWQEKGGVYGDRREVKGEPRGDGRGN